MTDRWRMGFHLMPPVGWMNDPNGLCEFRGVTHVFHQYSPTWPEPHAERGWGHFTSRDLVHWEHHGLVVRQDIPADASGAYSGSAMVVPDAAADGGDLLRLYYTGNVKEPGDYDYIHAGRQANQILIESEDGFALGPKQVLLTNADYPKNCSCHVRDPKLWHEDGSYWMLLGARDQDDHGFAFTMRSDDGLEWTLARTVTSEKPFGFMWECPDRIALDGREWLSICPQGMQERPWSIGLRDQSGYLPLPGPLAGEGSSTVREEDFRLWDHGFEFYAPQTYVDASGRTILIAWMGLPEAPWEFAPHGMDWIHCMTVPRVLTAAPDGGILQQPVPELAELRGTRHGFAATEDGASTLRLADHRADIEVTGITGDFAVTLDGALALAYSDGALTLSFADAGVGAGRTSRQAKVAGLHDLRVLVDSSAVEFYANGGQTVFSTRWFPTADELEVTLTGTFTEAAAWDMKDGMMGTYGD